jgi:hypothetical protein
MDLSWCLSPIKLYYLIMKPLYACMQEKSASQALLAHIEKKLGTT